MYQFVHVYFASKKGVRFFRPFLFWPAKLQFLHKSTHLQFFSDLVEIKWRAYSKSSGNSLQYLFSDYFLSINFDMFILLQTLIDHN